MGTAQGNSSASVTVRHVFQRLRCAVTSDGYTCRAKDMKHLLHQLGLALNADEVAALVAQADPEGSGHVGSAALVELFCRVAG
jgi:hypothetical protein